MASSLDNVSVKRALLIGNNRYSQEHRLEYCINNVNDLQNKLETIDFQVTTGFDLICEDFDSIVEDFVKDINPGDLILFLFSGYGIHSNDQNYFVPIDDNQIKNSEMFEHRTVNVQTIIDMIMNRRPSVSIFLFDCSRPYRLSNQITSTNFIDYGGFNPIQPLTNALIFFSCDANKTTLDKSTNGRNTIFLYYLLQYIDQPNLPIDELLDIVSDEITNETF
jgi:uncharacterized caspase-like protein